MKESKLFPLNSCLPLLSIYDASSLWQVTSMNLFMTGANQIRLQKQGFQTEEILEIIERAKLENNPVECKAEREMSRYGASSKIRMLADALIVELNTKNSVQFLVRDA